MRTEAEVRQRLQIYWFPPSVISMSIARFQLIAAMNAETRCLFVEGADLF